MVLNGARGETLRQMTIVLGFGGSSIDQINQSNTKLMKQISDHLTPQELLMANALWLEQRYRLDPGYARRVDSVYHAPVNLVSMSDSRTVNTINQ